MSKVRDKFQFGLDFQWDILRFTITDKQGYRALLLYKDSYFTLLDHQIIAHVLIEYYKVKKKVPKEPSILRELLRQEFKKPLYHEKLLIEDKKRILTLSRKAFKPVGDGETFLDECINFASYIEVKHVFQNTDIKDYNSYGDLSKKLKKAINIGRAFKKDKGTFLIADIRSRQQDRSFKDTIYPTPYRQLNRLTNGGGYEIASVICLMGPEKKFKTGMLINWAGAYLKKRKKVLYIDLENGEHALSVRSEQSIIHLDKMQILSGEYDKKIQKIFRKYLRLGSELVIKRMPAYRTTADDIQNFMDYCKEEYGIIFDIVIIDFAPLMSSLSKIYDDTKRISDIFVDIKNLADHNKLEILLTANHITKDGEKHTSSRYVPNDLAKCKDIGRHVDALIGLNQNDDEFANGVIRMEMVEQRDGVLGRAFFWVDIKKQTAKEFTHKEVQQVLKDFVMPNDAELRTSKQNATRDI